MTDTEDFLNSQMLSGPEQLAVAEKMREKYKENFSYRENEGESRLLSDVSEGENVSVATENEGQDAQANKAASGEFLKILWLNVIPSLGLTLVVINFYHFLRNIFPGNFCRFGEAFVPKTVKNKATREELIKTLGLGEKIMLFSLDILFLCLIIIFAAGILMVLESVFGFFGWLAKAITK